MLEPMPRSPSDEPHVRILRMPIHNEISIRSLLVLAHAALNQRRILQVREAKCNVLANILQCFLTDHPISAGWIELRTPRIIRNLEPPPVAPRNAVAKFSAMIGPDWKVFLGESHISGGRTEEKHVLLGRENPIPNSPSK